MWKNNFPTLKIPRYNALGACDKYLQLKLAKRKSIGKPEHVNAATALSTHLATVREERKLQTIRDQDATAFPYLTWTVTTDFMVDLALPWLSTRPKKWQLQKLSVLTLQV